MEPVENWKWNQQRIGNGTNRELEKEPTENWKWNQQKIDIGTNSQYTVEKKRVVIGPSRKLTMEPAEN